VVELVELAEHEHKGETDADALVQTADVSYPIEQAVNVSIHTIESQVEFKCELCMHFVLELVGSRQLKPIRKDVHLILGNLAELDVGVLQVQVRQLHLVDDLFAYLGVNRVPE